MLLMSNYRFRTWNTSVEPIRRTVPRFYILRRRLRRVELIVAVADNSSRRMLEIQLDTQRQYEQTMKNLEQVNATVTFIVTAIRDTESLIESKINRVTGLIGGTGRFALFIVSLI